MSISLSGLLHYSIREVFTSIILDTERRRNELCSALQTISLLTVTVVYYP